MDDVNVAGYFMAWWLLGIAVFAAALYCIVWLLDVLRDRRR